MIAQILIVQVVTILAVIGTTWSYLQTKTSLWMPITVIALACVADLTSSLAFLVARPSLFAIAATSAMAAFLVALKQRAAASAVRVPIVMSELRSRVAGRRLGSQPLVAASPLDILARPVARLILFLHDVKPR